MKTRIYLTYKLIFDDEPKDIVEYLKPFNRNFLIRTALELIQSRDKYDNIKDYVERFICKENIPFISNILNRIEKLNGGDSTDPTNLIPRSYFLISETTGLELLKHTFAIDPLSYKEDGDKVILEQNLFKAILLINSKISHFEVTEEFNDKGELSDLFYAKSFFCMYFNNFERTFLHPEYIILNQFIKGYYFFKYCENSKLKEHLKRFLEKNNINSWELYLYNVLKLLLFPLKNQNGYVSISLNEEREGYSFLHSHSFLIDTIIPLEKNNDYTFFKSNPLIEVDNKTFLPINTMFCINHLYKSIYFEFREINKELAGTEYFLNDRGLLTTFTTEFSEQYLFDMFVRKVLKKKHGIKLSDRECKAIKSIGEEPDFYFRDGNNIFIFENKDIMIADNIKNNMQYDEIEQTINNKLIKKSGISQLVKHIKKINNHNFIWDRNIPNNPRIYPILVIDDASLCVPGLNYILNTALQNQLIEAKIDIKVFPLVLLELDSLIAFGAKFEKGEYKLKEIIDRYYIFQTRKPRKVPLRDLLKEVFQKFFPFYYFLSTEIDHHPFDDTLFKEICEYLKEKTEGCDI